MKASAHFIDTLAQGIRLLRAKYGADAVAACKPFPLYFAVSDSVRPGFEHNAKVSMPVDLAFDKEARELNDAHIETAIKAAIRQA